MKDTDPDGPRQMIADIRAGAQPHSTPEQRRAAFAAQEKLNKHSVLEEPHKVLDINEAYLEGILAKSEGKKRQRAKQTLENGTVLTVWRTVRTDENGVVTKGPIKFEATLPKKPEGAQIVVYQFGDGELRVWRNRAGHIQQESIVGLKRERLGYEGMISSHRKGKYAGAITERAHAHGAGLGVESPFGIGLAPREVNQYLQNEGIEDYMRQLRDILLDVPGAVLSYSTIVEFAPLTPRLSRISYELSITMGGRRHPFASFAINIKTDAKGTRRADRKGTLGEPTVDRFKFHESEFAAVNRYFKHLEDRVVLPRQLEAGMTPADLAALRRASPELLASAAVSDGSPLALHPPPAVTSWDLAKWRDDLSDTFKKRPDLVVIDTRGMGYTAAQIRELEETIRGLTGRQRRKIVLLK